MVCQFHVTVVMNGKIMSMGLRDTTLCRNEKFTLLIYVLTFSTVNQFKYLAER